jgi:hypothetical protein
LAHNSASIDAMTASASAPDRITDADCASGATIGNPEKSTSTARIAALAVSGPITGPSRSLRPQSTTA